MLYIQKIEKISFFNTDLDFSQVTCKRWAVEEAITSNDSKGTVIIEGIAGDIGVLQYDKWSGDDRDGTVRPTKPSVTAAHT